MGSSELGAGARARAAGASLGLAVPSSTDGVDEAIGVDRAGGDSAPPGDAEGLDVWARQTTRQWRHADVIDALQPIAADEAAGRDRRAVALLWLLAAQHEGQLSAARALIADPGLNLQMRVRLAAVLARTLAGQDHPDAANVLDQAERLKRQAEGDIVAAVAVARVHVEIAAFGEELAPLRSALDGLVAVAAAAVLPAWVRDAVLATRIAGLRRSHEIDQAGIGLDEVEAVIDVARVDMAGRRPPDAAAAAVLLDAAGLALAVDRATAGLSLVTASAEAAGDAAPAGVRFAAALLASDCANAALGPAEALVHQRRAITLAGELDSDHLAGVAYRGMGLLLARLDRPDESDTHLARAADLFMAAGAPHPAAMVATQRARQWLGRHEPDRARDAADRTIAAIEPEASGPQRADHAAAHAAGLLCDALEVRSEADDLDGDYRAAANGWLRAADLASTAGRCGAGYRSAAASSFAWAGQIERARRLFGRALSEADDWDAETERPWYRASVLERRAGWHLDAGRTAEASADARAAASAFGATDDGAASARAGLLLGRTLAAAGEPLAAEAAWRSGLAAVAGRDDPGAEAVARRVHSELADLLDALGRSADAERHRRLAVAPVADWCTDGDGQDPDAAAELQAAHAGAAGAELAAGPGTAPDTVAALAVDPLVPVRAAVAARPALPPAVARRLARDPDRAVVAAIASNPGAPRSAIRRAARGRGSPDARRAAAANPNAGGGLLVRLALSRRWDVRRAVAANSACPRWLLVGLAFGRAWGVTEAVAAAPRTPRPLLRLYGRASAAALVRFAVAGNPSAPPGVARRLVRDKDPYVAGRAAGNPALRAGVLIGVFVDMTAPAWVLRRAAANPRCPPDLAEQILTWLALGGAHGDAGFDPVTCEGHPGDPEANAWQWYPAEAARTARPWRHPLWRIRAVSGAGRDSVPIAVLRQLARDPVPEVRRSVLSYFGLGQDAYRELCGDADPVVRAEAPKLLERQRKADRAGGWPAGEQFYRRVRIGVVLGSIIAGLGLFGNFGRANDRNQRVDPDALIEQFPGFTVEDGQLVRTPRDVTAVARVAALDDGGRVTVGRAPGGPDGLIVRVEAATSPIVVHIVTWEPVPSSASGTRFPQRVVAPQDHIDIALPGQPSRVRVVLTVLGRRETLHFEVIPAPSSTTGGAP